MKVIEATIRAELRSLGVSLRSSVGARVAVDLAKRMDAEPGDRSAVMQSRECRLVMATCALSRREMRPVTSKPSWRESPPPTSATPRTDRGTYGDDVAATAAMLGVDLMGWQQLARTTDSSVFTARKDSSDQLARLSGDGRKRLTEAGST